jgi:hypothetical protein
LGDASFVEYFRVPPDFAVGHEADGLSKEAGYFAFGGAVCYGRARGGSPAARLTPALPDRSLGVTADGRLPFSLAEVATNLREERYVAHKPANGVTSSTLTRDVYYALRPFLTVGVRKHLQRLRLRDWSSIAFPAWPVDVSVDTLMRAAMLVALRTRGIDRIPFIWFWPNGASSCGMMTHDVEGPAGEAFCRELMDVDESFGITSAFQIVPEARRRARPRIVDEIRGRGFEVNLHDLNHDGRLFETREQFLERAKRINRFAREMGCPGFRSGAMYREQSWFDAFEFRFDMSVPSVAHLEPQRGGCCTVMPYFVGNVLELPLTTAQDYSLFNILSDYSTTLWQAQITLIRESHGLISFIAHPDYLRDRRALAVYKELLAELAHLRDDQGVWMALPSEIDAWWRTRRELSLIRDGAAWRVVGAGSERARVGYASIDDGRVVYNVDPE